MSTTQQEFSSYYEYIIIGGGIAGVSCLEQLHCCDDSCSILLVTGGDFVKTTSNIQSITKTLDIFDIEESSLSDLENKYSKVNVVKAVVTGLDAKNQIIITNSKKYKYGKLCICTGAIPKVTLPSHPLVLWIRDTDSATKFQEKLTDATRIVVVGNGGIATELVYEVTGIEIVWAIRDKSLNAPYIDAGAAEFLQPNLLQSKCDDDSQRVSKRQKFTVNRLQGSSEVIGEALGPDWHAGLNINSGNERKVIIETEVDVKEILTPEQFESSEYSRKETSAKERWPVFVALSNGKVYGCDFIISATGVVPNTEVFSKSAPFELAEDEGLLVNEKMETSVPNVYAAGDACTAGWDIAPHWFQLRLWTQARQMGSYAAKCMLASSKAEEIHMDFCFELFSHATKFLGQSVVLLGLFNGQKLNGKYEILLRMTKGQEYIKCVMVNGRMQGALLVGDSGLEETFENLIINQMDLSSYGEDLLDPSVDIEDYFD